MGVTAASHTEPLIRKDETMRYRPLGRTGWMVSALSFGCMRLSEDMALNEKMISRAIDLGINYFETTRGYCNGQCQQRTAPGLVKKTKGVIISGKGSLGADTTAYSFRKEIDRQLDILGLDHFKFYQVGWIRWANFPHLLKRGGALDALRKAQDEGLVHYVGFTGHDKPENVIKMLETGLFDTATMPYNMINREYEPAIQRAAELGMGVVNMCPVGGGVLSHPSEALQKAIGLDLPTPAMALRFTLSNPAVSTACSGMNTMEMLEENVQAVHDFDPATGDFEGMCASLDQMRDKLGSKFCTGCRYCAGCPSELDIDRLMQIWQYGKVFGLTAWAKEQLKGLPEAKQPARCTLCGACEDKCPNTLKNRDRIEELKQMSA